MVHGVIPYGVTETANLNENYKKLFIIIVSGMEFEQNTIGAKSNGKASIRKWCNPSCRIF